jgi:hypothetical protein
VVEEARSGRVGGVMASSPAPCPMVRVGRFEGQGQGQGRGQGKGEDGGVIIALYG